MTIRMILLLLPVMVSAVTLESYNIPGTFIRHQDCVLRIDPVSTDPEMKDSTLCQVDESSIPTYDSPVLPGYHADPEKSAYNKRVYMFIKYSDPGPVGRGIRRVKAGSLAGQWTNRSSALFHDNAGGPTLFKDTIEDRRDPLGAPTPELPIQTVVPTATPTTVPAAVPGIPGHVDNDSLVDIVDAVLVA